MLSLLLSGTELLAPRLRGKCFDAVLVPGASFTVVKPQLYALAALAVLEWAIHIVSSILFARAKWTAAMAARVRLMGAVLEQEPAFYDGQVWPESHANIAPPRPPPPL
jgi:ABC-type multidrug transport system fused ATPase/permease subunit